MTEVNKNNKKRKLTLSIILRSIVFNFYFYGAVTLGTIFLFAPLSFCKSPKPMRKALLIVIESIIRNFERINNIKITEKGIQNIPEGKAFIFCSKHMSNIDALILYRRSPTLTALAKRELFWVPLLGLIFKKMEVPAINRGAGVAQKQTPEIAKSIINKKMPLIIFSEGTRTLPYERRPLKSGAYFYQKDNELDVVVVAHNSGSLWPKNSWIKWPGELIVEYSKPLPKDLDKEEFMEQVEELMINRSEQFML